MSRLIKNFYSGEKIDIVESTLNKKIETSV